MTGAGRGAAFIGIPMSAAFADPENAAAVIAVAANNDSIIFFIGLPMRLQNK
jgi:hypothetical protein